MDNEEFSNLCRELIRLHREIAGLQKKEGRLRSKVYRSRYNSDVLMNGYVIRFYQDRTFLKTDPEKMLQELKTMHGFSDEALAELRKKSETEWVREGHVTIMKAKNKGEANEQE